MSSTTRRAMQKEAGLDRNDSPALQGTIWKIDRNATHDGPGIRTLLYFKGCPLRCKWCSNPEGQLPEPVLVFQEAKCTDCELCLEACPTRALERDQPAKIKINRSSCHLCGDCVSACPTEALLTWGKSYSAPEILEMLERDRLIHRKSGGGLSCTGGDPLDQPEFLLELLEQCQLRGIHTAVETSACVDEKLFQAMLERVDWLFIDLKHMDPAKHLELTGKDNTLILSNTRLASSILQARGKSLVIRQVVIPGINDGQNIFALADFLASLPFVSGVELLAYHNYGVHKYDLLNRSYSLPEVQPPTAEEMEGYRKILRDRVLNVI